MVEVADAAGVVAALLAAQVLWLFGSCGHEFLERASCLDLG